MFKKTLFTTLFVIALTLAFSTSVWALPQQPYTFWGTLTVNGAYAPEGAVVTAWVDGVQRSGTATITIVEEGGVDVTYYSNLDVLGDDPDTAEVEGAVAGQTIVFKVDGTDADQTAIWQPDQPTTRLNLTATASNGEVAFSCTPRSGSADLLVNCTNQSTIPNIVSSTWQFGTSGTANTHDASYTFTTNGSHDVTLTVTDNNGDTYSETKTGYITLASDNCEGADGVSRACGILTLQGRLWVQGQNILFPSTVVVGQDITVEAEVKRWTAANSGAPQAWLVTLGTATDFISSADYAPIPASGFSVWCDSVSAESGSDTLPTCSDTTGLFLNNDVPLLSGTNSGSYSFNLNARLVIPAGTVGDSTYQSIVPITIAYVP